MRLFTLVQPGVMPSTSPTTRTEEGPERLIASLSSRHPQTRLHTTCSEGAWVAAAIHEKIVSGDVAGVDAAQEREGGPELLNRAETVGRNGLQAVLTCLVHAFVMLLREGLEA